MFKTYNRFVYLWREHALPRVCRSESVLFSMWVSGLERMSSSWAAPRGMFLIIVLKIYDSAFYVWSFNFKERLNQKIWRFG